MPLKFWSGGRANTSSADGGALLRGSLLFWMGALGLPLVWASPAPRIPWTSSNIHGSPEPPLPYVAERVFPQLEFKEPTEISFIPGSLYGLVIEREGKVWAFRNEPGTAEAMLIADLGQATGPGGEAYSITYHPRFARNRQVYVSLFLRAPAPARMRISRFVLEDASPPRLELDSELPVIEWLSDGHNGCSLQFGLDGFLYISTGDGAGPAPPDPLEAGQDLTNLLSCIARIDVDQPEGGKAYRAPPDNPFVDLPEARPEIWAYGFRNPWKISVDPRDGALWVADVGWEAWELVFRITQGGFNGGWSIMEGPQPVNTSWKAGPTPIRAPLLAHPHTEAASITGGYVYRGRRFPELRHAYIYGDWETGKIWELLYQDGATVRRRELAATALRIIGFGEDAGHELFFADYTGGGLYRLTPNEPLETSAPAFPRLLSQTGLFDSTASYQFAPGVVPYSLAAPAWADHAIPDFAVAVPGLDRVTPDPENAENPRFPSGSVVLRTFSMEPDASRRIETQFLHFDGVMWNGYTYRWNEDQTDAELVEKDGAERMLTIEDASVPGGLRRQVWRFHSRAECMRCHMTRFGFLNGYIPEQLSRPLPRNPSTNQLELLDHLGLIHRRPRAQARFTLAHPSDDSAPVEKRARSWLHANCAHCHREYASGAVMMFLHAEMPLEKTLTAGHPPSRGGFGIPDARLIAPGEPLRSALLYRVLTPSGGRMPILGSSEVDAEGVRLLRRWIEGLPADPAGPNGSGGLEQTVQRLEQRFQAGDPDWKDQLDRLLGTTPGAMALALAAHERSLPRSLRQPVLEAASAHPHFAARDLFEPFLPFEQRRRTLGPDFHSQLVLARPGDSERGRQLYFSEQGCQSCHRLTGEGRDFGPDLSAIGARYNRAELLDHILRPSQQVEPEWRGWTVETADGEHYSGFLLEQVEERLRLKIADGSVVEVERRNLVRHEPLEGSLMPEGLLQGYTAQEASDLLEFLTTLR